MKTLTNNLWPVPQITNPPPRVARYIAACEAGNQEYHETGSIALAERKWMELRMKPLDNSVNPS